MPFMASRDHWNIGESGRKQHMTPLETLHAKVPLGAEQEARQAPHVARGTSQLCLMWAVVLSHCERRGQMVFLQVGVQMHGLGGTIYPIQMIWQMIWMK